MPGNPAADDKGYVKMPNVNMLVEMADMREANRSYKANTQVIKQVRELVSMTIDLMRNQDHEPVDRDACRRTSIALGGAAARRTALHRHRPGRLRRRTDKRLRTNARIDGHRRRLDDQGRRNRRPGRHEGPSDAAAGGRRRHEAEQTLQTAVAIRDKVVSAYLEVSRMQI